MKYSSDTIAAISTPPGVGALSVIRVSGKEAISVVQKYFSKSLDGISSHTIVHGFIKDAGRIIDEVILSLFKAPHSYTGEDVVEISCHGNPFIANQILELLLRDIRLAERGEFTQRAFLHNKLDLTQAEAVADLINAKTKASQQAALQQMKGALHHRIATLLEELTEYRTQLEVEIDFAEQDVPEIDLDTLKEKLKVFYDKLEDLIHSGQEGTILREGFRVGLVGAPNVGKSSVFNAFLKTERAIVTPTPGTTRDYLEEVISLKGYLVKLYDTAGLRETDDPVEKIGVQRTYEIVRSCHKVLFIADSHQSSEEYEDVTHFIPPENIIKVINKTDVMDEATVDSFLNNDYLPCSTQTQTGLDALKEKLLDLIKVQDTQLGAGILTNIRQIAATRKAISAIENAIRSIDDKLGVEFTAFDLKEASTALEEIIGKVSSDDILNRIFDNFCIGK
jgi:tRNA modification GTPase